MKIYKLQQNTTTKINSDQLNLRFAHLNRLKKEENYRCTFIINESNETRYIYPFPTDNTIQYHLV